MLKAIKKTYGYQAIIWFFLHTVVRIKQKKVLEQGLSMPQSGMLSRCHVVAACGGLSGVLS
jgi:hypothetical protein